jgi:hypothetical protein
MVPHCSAVFGLPFFWRCHFFPFLSALPFFSPFSREHHTELYANISHNAQDVFSIYTRIIHTTPKMFSALLQMELVPGCEETEGAQRNSRNSDINIGKQQKQQQS